MKIARSDWKYLLRELMIAYNLTICEKLRISKVSLYKWIKGETIPHLNIQKQIIGICRESPEELVRISKAKEEFLEKLSRIKDKRNIINVAFLIRKEIERRSKSNANTWYLKYIDDNIIKIKYFDSNKYWKIVAVPVKIRWNVQLATIFSFWLGDGVTKKVKYALYRPYLTFVNKDIDLLMKIKKFLSDVLLQEENVFDVEVIKGELFSEDLIYYEERINLLCDRVRWRTHGNWNSIGFCLHVRNAPLSLIFDYLLKNKEFLLKNSSNNVKGAFLAGYFSAEGNVSRINRWFSFHETKRDRRSIIKKALEALGFSPTDFGDRVNIAHRDDIREKDILLFSKFIKKYLISESKKKQTDLLVRGHLQRDLDLLYMYYLFLKQETTSYVIAKDFCKNIDHINKVFRCLEANKPKLVIRTRKRRNEFNTIKLTHFGQSVVNENHSKILSILREIKRLDKYERHYLSSFILTNPKTKQKVKAIQAMLDASGLY